jgi:SAM-dependent methyltransferase
MTREHTGGTGRSVGGPRSRRPRVFVEDGGGRRTLRVDGTYASVYRPGRIATGSVWDALAAPILALPPERRTSVLILGLGGGSAARLARALAPEARIVGVELDAEVIAAAREHFGLDALGIETVEGDARAFLATARERFDVVIEDVFVGAGRDVRKPDWLPAPGLLAAARLLAPGGVLVTNVIDEAPAAARLLLVRFGAATRLTIDGYDNAIFAAGEGAQCGLAPRALRAAVAADPVLAPTLRRLRMRALDATPRGTAARGG